MINVLGFLYELYILQFVKIGGCIFVLRIFGKILLLGSYYAGCHFRSYDVCISSILYYACIYFS